MKEVKLFLLFCVISFSAFVLIILFSYGLQYVMSTTIIMFIAWPFMAKLIAIFSSGYIGSMFITNME